MGLNLLPCLSTVIKTILAHYAYSRRVVPSWPLGHPKETVWPWILLGRLVSKFAWVATSTLHRTKVSRVAINDFVSHNDAYVRWDMIFESLNKNIPSHLWLNLGGELPIKFVHGLSSISVLLITFDWLTELMLVNR